MCVWNPARREMTKASSVSPEAAKRTRIESPADKHCIIFGQSLTKDHPEPNIKAMSKHMDDWQRLIFPETWAMESTGKDKTAEALLHLPALSESKSFEDRHIQQIKPARIALARFLSFKSGLIEMFTSTCAYSTMVRIPQTHQPCLATITCSRRIDPALKPLWSRRSHSCSASSSRQHSAAWRTMQPAAGLSPKIFTPPVSTPLLPSFLSSTSTSAATRPFSTTL